jgi:succinate dehydrogenase / fumarate reductase flavoprotein subunit
MMQDLVGIVRRGPEMERALDELAKLSERAIRVAAPGNREYNPGWHTALDLHNLLTVSQAITLSAIERKESRGAQFRDDHPDKDEAFGRINIAIRKGEDGRMEVSRRPVPELSPDQAAVIEEMK